MESQAATFSLPHLYIGQNDEYTVQKCLKGRPSMKKLLTAVLALSLLGCKTGTVTLEGNTVKISTAPSAADAVQIPNPFTSRAGLADAAKAAGFELAVPEKVNGSPRRDIQTIDGEMIQVFYGDEDDEVCIRKAPGGEDISGDYNSYAQVTAVDVDGTSVTMKGENSLIRLALWTSGGYTYSISARSGMSSSDMAALVRSVR